MNHSDSLSTFLMALSHYPLLIALSLFLVTFILEDLATTTGALLASQAVIAPELVLIALLSGIILGDLFLYLLGHLARHYQWAKALLAKNKIKKTRDFVQKNLIGAILLARFIPGMRLPAYTSMGLFNLNFKIFALTVIVAVSAWTILLFTLIYKLGEAAMPLISMYHWTGLAIVIGLIIVIPLFSHFIGRFIFKGNTHE